MISLRLLCRCLGALINCERDTLDDADRVLRLIATIPDMAEQIELFSEVALRYAAAGFMDSARRMVQQQIVPVLTNLRRFDPSVYGEAVASCAAALYITQPANALDTIAHILPSHRDAAYVNIVRFVMTKAAGDDNPVNLRNEWPLEMNDVASICDVLMLMTDDAEIYTYISGIAASTKKFDGQQIADIAERLTEIAKAKFPSKTGITHEGYAIATATHVLKLKNTKAQEWLDLIERAKQIPNVADKALVLALIAKEMPTKRAFESHRDSVVEEAIRVCEQIPSVDDKIRHFSSLAEAVAIFDNKRALDLFKRAAMSLAKDGRTALHLTLVDAAYHADPNMAKVIAKIFDEGQGSDVAKKRVQQRVRLLQSRKTFAGSSQDTARLTDREFATVAAWLLGEIIGDRYQSAFHSEADHWLERAGNMRLEWAFPVFSLYIENEARRLKRSQAAKSELRALLDAVEEAAKFAISLVQHSTSHQRVLRSTPAASKGQSLVVRVGERQTAVEYIRGWIDEHAANYLKISDPYFDPDQLWIARLVGNLKPNVTVTILTGNHSTADESAYKKAWRESPFPSRTSPQIIVVGDAISGASPIHDRWIVTRGKGLRLGTSLNALGERRVTEISDMSSDEAALVETSFDEVATRRVQQVGGRGIDYRAFFL
jgi:hypothetical protein